MPSGKKPHRLATVAAQPSPSQQTFIKEVEMNALKKIGTAVVAFAPLPAMAAADLTPITGAQTDLLAYAGALLALGIAVWAALKVVRMFGGK